MMNEYEQIKDIDSDSGISTVTRSRPTVAALHSKANTFANDGDDEELLSRANFSEYDDSHRDSNSSSITNYNLRQTSSDFQLNSTASSSASQINAPISSLSMVGVTSKQSLTDRDTKPRTGSVRHFLRKFFNSSTSTNRSNTTSKVTHSLNVDRTHGTAYPPMTPLPVTQGPIRLFILRHGERVDKYYSSQWLRQAFDKDNQFCRFSPILPETVPLRASIDDFDLDPPLTSRGLKDAYYTGTILKEKNMNIHYCYSSPSLRCIQTATKLLEGLQLNQKLKIRIEPGLFECTAWYTADETTDRLTMPRFMTKKELLENKYPIDKTYHEQMSIAEVSELETELQFYERSHAVASSILQMHEKELNQTSSPQHIHVLFIAHAPTLETCTRKLCGGKFRPKTLEHVIRNVDFLTMTVIEKTDNRCDQWIFRRNSFYGDEF